jgi:tripartite-type tricarboxylate transporter receptor subunit TctC
MTRITAAITAHLCAVALFALAIAATGPARAEDQYPTRLISIVLPQPAGGAVDLIARTLGERLSESMKQPVIIENKPGANGSLAAGQVARATPDGYTLFLAVDTNLVVNPSLYPDITYDPFKDFVPIGVIAKLYLALVSNPKLPVDNIADLIKLAKAKPGKLNYGSIGYGSPHHLGMELFKLETKTDLMQVQFRGTAATNAALIGGVVDVGFTGPQAAISLAKSDKLKILAVTSPQRSKLLPNVPTMQEQGVPGFELSTWFGLLAPANTPKSIVDKLSREMRKAVADPEFKNRITTLGLDVVGSTPEEMLALMKTDTVHWRNLIETTHAKVR